MMCDLIASGAAPPKAAARRKKQPVQQLRLREEDPKSLTSGVHAKQDVVTICFADLFFDTRPHTIPQWARDVWPATALNDVPALTGHVAREAIDGLARGKRAPRTCWWQRCCGTTSR